MSGLDVRTFTVGPIQENAYIVRAAPDAKSAVIVDPGEEAERLLELDPATLRGRAGNAAREWPGT